MNLGSAMASTHMGTGEEPSESVDLLQMVPDLPEQRVTLMYDPSNCPKHSMSACRAHSVDCAGVSRSHLTMLNCDETADNRYGDSTDAGHVCLTCRENVMSGGENVYSYHSPRYVKTLPSRSGIQGNSSRSATQEEGASYFNYLRFANSSTGSSPCMLNSTYEPVSRKRRKTRTDILSSFLCCTKKDQSKTKTKPKPKSKRGFNNVPENDDSGFMSKPEKRDVVSTRVSSGSGNKDWRRIKRLLLLSSVLLGILLAVGGMVVGFLVIAPGSKEKTCGRGSVYCGSRGCVSLQTLCTRAEILCPRVNRMVLCNKTASFSSADSDLGSPSATNTETRSEAAIKDLSGWVHFDGGSTNGSKYIVVNSPMTFYGGQDECRKRGAYLVHVNTIREQIFLEDFLQQELLNLDVAAGAVGFWLGARRARGSHSGTCLYKQWKWVDPYGLSHGFIAGFTAFMPGKPDNHFSPEECLYINFQHRDPHSFLKWDDAPCDINNVGPLKVVCEMSLR